MGTNILQSVADPITSFWAGWHFSYSWPIPFLSSAGCGGWMLSCPLPPGWRWASEHWGPYQVSFSIDKMSPMSLNLLHFTSHFPSHKRLDIKTLSFLSTSHFFNFLPEIVIFPSSHQCSVLFPFTNIASTSSRSTLWLTIQLTDMSGWFVFVTNWTHFLCLG